MEGRLTGSFLGGGAVGCRREGSGGSGATFWHLNSDVGWSQDSLSQRVVFFVKGSLTLGFGDAMDLRCIAAVSGIIS